MWKPSNMGLWSQTHLFSGLGNTDALSCVGGQCLQLNDSARLCANLLCWLSTRVPKQGLVRQLTGSAGNGYHGVASSSPIWKKHFGLQTFLKKRQSLGPKSVICSTFATDRNDNTLFCFFYFTMYLYISHFSRVRCDALDLTPPQFFAWSALF